MKRYLFIVIILLLTASLAVHANIKDLQFVNRSYKLDSKYLPQLIAFSQEYDIRIETLHNWIMAESSGREKAYNKRSGDKGLCQLHNVNYLTGKYWNTNVKFNVWNGKHNLSVALAYLGDLIDRHGTYYGIMAYNIGTGRILRGEILDCGIAYVNRILPEENEPVTICYPLIYRYSILTFQEQILFDRRTRYV